MHRLLTGILLAGIAATPVLAAPPNKTDRGSAGVQHESRPQHSAPATSRRERAEPMHGGAQGQAQSPGRATVRIIKPTEAERPTPAQRIEDRKDGRKIPALESPRQVPPPKTQTRDLQTARPVPNVTPPPPVVSNVPKAGTQPPAKVEARPTPAPQWNVNWRNNHRYDWNKWRRHHRHRFHLYAYFDPFGWGYYPFSIGWRLWPGYYGNRYWIMDPWYYRLPSAPPGTRWVRYYNDVLLVDMWSGEVIDVIHNFFW